MLSKISWPAASVCAVAIAGGVVLSVMHAAMPAWLAGIIVAIAGALPGILRPGAPS